jgi:trans-aconitate 2-methyltransferase
MQRFLFSCLLIFLTMRLDAATEHWDRLQVRRYANGSELQRKWAMRHLSTYPFRGNERVLDIGCGDGKITADISFYVPYGQVVGLEPKEAMLDWARRKYSSSDYPNLAFYQGDFASMLNVAPFDLVFSTCVLHLVSNHKEAFANVYNTLKPAGSFLAVVPAAQNQLFFQAINDTIKLPRWMHYFGLYRLSIAPRNCAQFETVLEEVGFKVKRVELVMTEDPFFDIDDFAHWIMGTHREVQLLPEHLQRQFAYEIVERYLELAPASQRADGSIISQFGHIEIEATR